VALVFISTADTDLLAVHRAAERLPESYGPIETHNPPRLSDAQLDDLEGGVRAGRVWAVALRLHGGRRSFPEGLDRLRLACLESAVPLLAWPGERGQDLELELTSTAPRDLLAAGARYLAEGGLENVEALLRVLSDRLRDTELDAAPVREMARTGIYLPGESRALTRAEWQKRRRGDRPVVAVGFYRSHWMSGNTGFVDVLAAAIEEAGGDPLPFFCYSLRDEGPGEMPAAVADLLLEGGHPVCDCLILTFSFAVAEVQIDAGTVADTWTARWLERLGVPVVQGVTSIGTQAEWEADTAGLRPLDVVMQVALPEFDGRITGPPFSFKEVGDGPPRYVADPERSRALARLAVAHARLRSLPNGEKKLALVLSSYPTKNARVGNAVGLDTPASALALLRRLGEAGYDVGERLPEDPDELIQSLIAAGAYDREYLVREQMRQAAASWSVAAYRFVTSNLPEALISAVSESWGQPPGDLYVEAGRLYFAGLRFGNVLLTIQPPRGFGENPVAVYHDPRLSPTHHYVAFYRWLEEEYGAHAIVHLGKHGTLEWLPGKAVGLSGDCFPDRLLGAVPLLYPFVVNDPGEGVQAKRRAHAVIIDHLIPPMTRADSYGLIAELEQLMDEYYHLQTMDPSKLPHLQDRIWSLVEQANLHRDLGEEQRPHDFDGFVLHMDGYLCELKDAQIRGGLHVLGSVPDEERLLDLLVELTRRSNEGRPGLRTALSELSGLPEPVTAGRPLEPAVAVAITELGRRWGAALPALSDEASGQDALHEVSRAMLREAIEGRGLEVEETLAPTLDYVHASLLPRLRRTSDELDHLLSGLAGGFVPAGPSGAPTRGMAHVLPTGRNFYAVDPKALPSEIAYEVGGELAQALLDKHLEEEGSYPETVGIVVWGTAAMRTHGDDIGEVLQLLGVRPRWDRESRRVSGLEVIPATELDHPRIDVVLRISGFFRDAFPNLVHLVDEAIELVAVLDEPDEKNYVAKHYRAERDRKQGAGVEGDSAHRTSLYRIFGSPPGTYGAGVLPLIDAGNWRDVADLARAYEAWGAYAYGRREYGADAVPEFRRRFAAITVAVKNQDNREHDLLDSDDYLQYHGGMIATVRALSGQAPKQYHGDSSDPSRVRVRDLSAEVRRVFRTRALNPKWIEGMMRHGYKGGFEMAATTDYLFGYDATTGVAEDWMYESLARAYALDPEVQAFLREKNPWALLGILRRLFEAAERRLWEHPPEDLMAELRRLYWELDAYLEAWRETRVQARSAAGAAAEAERKEVS
jgi:cobaltochelatase CobN